MRMKMREAKKNGNLAPMGTRFLVRRDNVLDPKLSNAVSW